MSNSKLILAASLAAAFAANANAAVEITAGYDGYYDSSFFSVFNNTSSNLTNVVFTGTQGGGSAQQWSWGNIAAGDTVGQDFNDTGAFQYDYDDYYFGNDVTYTFSGSLNGQNVSLTFSPSSNASGGFVGFLGNDIDGYESDAQVSTYVGSAVSSVPEPASLGLMLAGLGLVGAAARRRRS
jgi:hypothetical protein